MFYEIVKFKILNFHKLKLSNTIISEYFNSNNRIKITSIKNFIKG